MKLYSSDAFGLCSWGNLWSSTTRSCFPASHTILLPRASVQRWHHPSLLPVSSSSTAYRVPVALTDGASVYSSVCQQETANNSETESQPPPFPYSCSQQRHDDGAIFWSTDWNLLLGVGHRSIGDAFTRIRKIHHHRYRLLDDRKPSNVKYNLYKIKLFLQKCFVTYNQTKRILSTASWWPRRPMGFRLSPKMERWLARLWSILTLTT